MAAKGSSNSQLLSQLNSCLKELLATESGPEDPQLCARTRDALLALMQACPGKVALSTLLSVVEFLVSKFPLLFQAGFQGVFISNLLRITLSCHRDAIQQLPALVSLVMGVAALCGPQTPTVLSELHYGCCDLLLDAEHQLLLLSLPSSTKRAGGASTDSKATPNLAASAGPSGDTADTHVPAFVGLSEWHSRDAPSAGPAGDPAAGPAAGGLVFSTHTGQLVATLDTYEHICSSAQASAQLLSALMHEAPHLLTQQTPSLLVNTLMQLAAHGTTALQASCWLALSALVCASGGMGAALFVPVTAVLDLALWTVQAWRDDLLTIPAEDLTPWCQHMSTLTAACVDKCTDTGLAYTYAGEMVDCLVQLAARLAASPADTATAAAADASTTAAASAAQQAAAAGSAAAAAAVQRLEAAAALLQSAAVVLRCMPVGLHTVGSALPQVVRLMCALPENTSTPAVQAVWRYSTQVLQGLTDYLNTSTVTSCAAASILSRIPSLAPLVISCALHATTPLQATTLSTNTRGDVAQSAAGTGAAPAAVAAPAAAPAAQRDRDRDAEVIVIDDDDDAAEDASAEPARKKRKKTTMRQTQLTLMGTQARASALAAGEHGDQPSGAAKQHTSTTDAITPNTTTGGAAAADRRSPSPVPHGARGAVVALAALFAPAGGAVAAGALPAVDAAAAAPAVASLRVEAALNPDAACAARALVTTLLSLSRSTSAPLGTTPTPQPQLQPQPQPDTNTVPPQDGPFEQQYMRVLQHLVAVMGLTCSTEVLAVLLYSCVSWLRRPLPRGSGADVLQAARAQTQLAVAVLSVVQARLCAGLGLAGGVLDTATAQQPTQAALQAEASQLSPQLAALLQLVLEACVLCSERVRSAVSQPATADRAAAAALAAIIAAAASVTAQEVTALAAQPDGTTATAAAAATSPPPSPGGAGPAGSGNFARHAHELAVKLLAAAGTAAAANKRSPEPAAAAAAQANAAAGDVAAVAAAHTAAAVLYAQAAVQLSAMRLAAAAKAAPADPPLFARLALGWEQGLQGSAAAVAQTACVESMRAVVQACVSSTPTGILAAFATLLTLPPPTHRDLLSAPAPLTHTPHPRPLMPTPRAAQAALAARAASAGGAAGSGTAVPTQPVGQTQALVPAGTAGGNSGVLSGLSVCDVLRSPVWWPHVEELDRVLAPVLYEVYSRDASYMAASEALSVIQVYLDHAPASMLSGCRRFIESLFKLIGSSQPAIRQGMVALTRSFARPEVLTDAFASTSLLARSPAADPAPAPAPPDAATLASCETNLLGRFRKLLQAKDLAIHSRVAVLQACASLDGLVHVAPGSEQSPLLVLTGCLGMAEPQLRAAAGELLTALCARRGQSVHSVLLQSETSRHVMEYVGRHLSDIPLLLSELSQWLGHEESELAERMLPHVIGWLCMHSRTDELSRLAALTNTTVQHLFVKYSNFAIAQAFLESNQQYFESFINFTDDFMKQQEGSIMEVIAQCARDIAEQVVWMAGRAERWPAYELPDPLYRSTVKSLAHISETLHISGLSADQVPKEAKVAELLAGDKVATFLKELGVTFGQAVAQALLTDASGPPALALCLRRSASIPALTSDTRGALVTRSQSVTSSALLDSEPRQLQSLRALAILLQVLGTHVSDHVFHVAAVLTAALRGAPTHTVKLQALHSWRVWIACLAKRAPTFLHHLVAQTAVVLLPYLTEDGDDVQQVATSVMDELIHSNKQHTASATKNLPPLPSLRRWSSSYRDVNASKQFDGRQFNALIPALVHDSLVVRHSALKEMRNFLEKNKRWIHILVASALGIITRGSYQNREGEKLDEDTLRLMERNSEGNRCKGGSNVRYDHLDTLHGLLCNLLQCTHNVNRTSLVLSLRERCAECLGYLGPIDPARMNVEIARPDSLIDPGETGLDLAHLVITKHLLRMLMTADDIQSLEFTSYTLQSILQRYSDIPESSTDGAPVAGSKSSRVSGSRANSTDGRTATPTIGGLFAMLSKEQQEICQPFLYTKWKVSTTADAANRAGGAAETSESGMAAAAGGGAAGAAAGGSAQTSQSILHTRQLSYRRWLDLWLRRMIGYTTGPCQALFAALTPSLKFDLPLMTFTLPYVVHNLIVTGNKEAIASIKNEIITVLSVAAQQAARTQGQAAASSAKPTGNIFKRQLGMPPKPPRPTSTTPAPAAEPVAELELYLQAIFTLLDVLSRWVRDAPTAATAAASGRTSSRGVGSGTSGAAGSDATTAQPGAQTDPTKAVAEFIRSIPKEAMAQAALRCGANARALLYYESWVRERQGGALNPAARKATVSYTTRQVSFLLEVYSQLEEPDGMAGFIQLRPGGLRPTDAIIAAEKAGQWSEALAMYEQLLGQTQGSQLATNLSQQTTQGTQSQGPSAGVNPGQGEQRGAGGDTSAEALSLQQGALRGLLHLGHLQALVHQVDGLLARLPSNAEHAAARAQVAAAGVAAAWRLGRWDLLQEYLALAQQELDHGSSSSPGHDTSTGVNGGWSFDGLGSAALPVVSRAAAAAGRASVVRLNAQDEWELCLGGLLLNLQAGEYMALNDGMAAVRRHLITVLPALSQESYTRAYPTLVKLSMLQEAQDVAGLRQLVAQGQNLSPRELERRLKWSDRSMAAQMHLSLQEAHLSLRRQLASLMSLHQEVARCRLQYAKMCRTSGHFEAAEAAVLEAVSAGEPGAVLERSKLLWHSGRERRALAELSVELNKLDTSGLVCNKTGAERLHRAQLTLQLAKWTAEQGQQSYDALKKLFEGAIRAEPNWEKPYFQYARYLDHLYQDAKARQTSKGKTGSSKSGMGGGYGGRKDDRLGGRARIALGDERPYYDYLPDILTNYGRCIEKGNHHVLQCLPRMLTLYCDHGTDQLNRGQKAYGAKEKAASASVVNLMQGFAKSIPPVAWLVSLSQIISRITHKHGEVADVMQRVLQRCLEAFPHHTLWAMACLIKSQSRTRQAVAQSILHSARQTGGTQVVQLIDNFKSIMEGLMSLTNYNPSSTRTVRAFNARDKFEPLMRTLAKCQIMVPVQEAFNVTLPPVPIGSAAGTAAAVAAAAAKAAQSNLVVITGMKDEVLVMQSLQKPKKITLTGSDGKDYPFLAKPKDDLRKDYRLMDFAGVANRLFAANSASRRRGLKLRTYAVVVLTEDCGILQWLNHLSAFKHAVEESYVLENVWKKSSDYVPKVRNIWENYPPNDPRTKLMDKVLAMFPPKLHVWWLARFPEPAAWLQARLAFTRTNASWCMTGHILGLGDRHGENIMIDTHSGDTVHVDFGMLFDKGITLEVPEMVPFRLTQNMVDSFGVSGVEGAFRKSAENTLQVLRQHRATLMTCAETFLYDPLVDWARRKGEAATQTVEGTGEQENPMAKDALATIEGRLTGTLLGVSSQPSLPLSVEGHAARLMEEAMDHENLGRMYIWWMPWF